MPLEELLTLCSERRGSSPLERASATLGSAVEYLLDERLGGRCEGGEATRHAIDLLCGAARLVQGEERRRRPQQIIAQWLRNADRRRAALDDPL